MSEGAPAEAAALWRRCLEEPLAAGERFETMLALGTLECARGEAAGLERLERAHSLAPDPGASARAALARGRVLQLQGRLEREDLPARGGARPPRHGGLRVGAGNRRRAGAAGGQRELGARPDAAAPARAAAARPRRRRAGQPGGPGRGRRRARPDRADRGRAALRARGPRRGSATRRAAARPGRSSSRPC